MSHLLYSAIGDSITLGTGTILFSPTFPDYYRSAIFDKLEEHVLLTKYARNGATTRDVRDWLEQSLPIEHANVITITAGGNDLIDAAEEFAINKEEVVFQKALEVCCTNMNWIVSHLSMTVKKPAMIRIVNLYNPYPHLSFAKDWVNRFNQNLVTCTKNNDVKVADAYRLFEGNEERLLSFDGIHPNECGHMVISEALVYTGISL
ncbi:SGNH/GDSL hydrolase family protein [Alkalihalobacillus sp. CinArs1]|uniref:SGNH/GDSL hydrolase family protein n=1 Tax=Alkalihalobacillus sp. CinArs1 TaxID=2995314 RepID=UPI0022DD2985|nr:SGNH/GDSL hydrolase family protein [Alkalihalobacillus sp. CinArs1]